MNRKEIAINQKLSEPFIVGEDVYIERRYLQSYNQDNYEKRCNILSINDETATVVPNESVGRSYNVEVPISVLKKVLFDVGYNPINDNMYNVKTISFSLESIVHSVGFDRRSNRYVDVKDIVGKISVDEINWNPYVFQEDGNKFYYQRDFCWTLKDKQNLIDSIYNNISIGRVIIRERSYNWIRNQISNGNTEVAFKDIIDGKQRLNAIIEFISDKFADSNGYYYSEFSDSAKNKFLDNQLLGYAVLGEKSSDKDVIECFLKTNFAGVPMSTEHIEYVKSIKL